jgi:hypothetical protein
MYRMVLCVCFMYCSMYVPHGAVCFMYHYVHCSHLAQTPLNHMSSNSLPLHTHHTKT